MTLVSGAFNFLPLSFLLKPLVIVSFFFAFSDEIPYLFILLSRYYLIGLWEVAAFSPAHSLLISYFVVKMLTFTVSVLVVTFYCY